MKFILKKQIFMIILATAAMITPLFGMQESISKISRQISNTTKTRKIILGTLAAYTLYRSAQSYARNQAIKNFPTNNEEVIAQPKGVVTLFAHGLGADHNHGYHYTEYDVFFKDNRVNKEQQLNVFDFQDSPAYRIPSCLAQDADINDLKQEYDELVAQGYQVNLHGVSRGASTIFNFLAIYQPKNVRCAILESPFDDLETIIQNKLSIINYIPIIRSIASAAVTFLATRLPFGLQNHSVYGITPKKVAHMISKHIPILFISSKQDALIPYTSTQKLFNERQNSGHEHCYSIVVDHGHHGNILNDINGNKVIEAIRKFVDNPKTNPDNSNLITNI